MGIILLILEQELRKLSDKYEGIRVLISCRTQRMWMENREIMDMDISDSGFFFRITFTTMVHSKKNKKAHFIWTDPLDGEFYPECGHTCGELFAHIWPFLKGLLPFLAEYEFGKDDQGYFYKETPDGVRKSSYDKIKDQIL